MSVSVLRPCPTPDTPPRKRTSSFSFPGPAFDNANPRPTKVPRLSLKTMGAALKRTESCVSVLEDCGDRPTAKTATTTTTPPIPYTRTLQYRKDQRDARRKAAAANRAAADNLTAPAHRPRRDDGKPQAMPPRRGTPQAVGPLVPVPVHSSRSSRSRSVVTLSNAPASVRRSTPPAKVIMPSASSPHAVMIYSNPQRTNSPLAPAKTVLPARPVFPRSKCEPDLYKRALIGRMKTSDEGRKILTMGPRLAISIWMATKDLERMVEDIHNDIDVVMDDVDAPSVPSPAPLCLTKSWVVVRPNEDWEMVDCAA